MLKSFFNLVKRIENKIYPVPQQPQNSHAAPHVSYSQCGEDLLVKYIFNLRGIVKPSYIDIGANDPFFLSNTAIFYLDGCIGINIDANPFAIEKFKLSRPKDTNLNIGIGTESGEMDFYVMEDDTLSTFSKEEIDAFISYGHKLERVLKVKLVNLKEIIEKNCNGIFPDFLSLDVEGFDFSIIQSINFETSAPKIICVEAAEYSPIGAGARRIELIDYLITKGYYEYANTNLNAIMVKKDFWFI